MLSLNIAGLLVVIIRITVPASSSTVYSAGSKPICGAVLKKISKSRNYQVVIVTIAIVKIYY